MRQLLVQERLDESYYTLGTGMKILIIEHDQDLTRNMVREWLKSTGDGDQV